MKSVNAFALLLTVVLLSCSTSRYAPEKSSPFTAVEWEQDIPRVRFNNTWMYFEGIGQLTSKTIVAYCKKTYGAIWKKRFSEDFVEVLDGMGQPPTTTVNLKLRQGDNTVEYMAEMSEQNRRSVVLHNHKLALLDPAGREREKKVYRRFALHPQMEEVFLSAMKESGDTTLVRLYQELFAEIQQEFKEPIEKGHALEDIQSLVEAIRNHYSYAERNGIDYTAEFMQLYKQFPDSVNPTTFAIEIQKKLALFGDGHTRVNGLSGLLGNGYLPFIVAPYQGKVLCIHPDGDRFLEKNYPFLKSINGIEVDRLLDEAQKIVAAGSEQFVTSQSVARLAFIRYLLSALQVPNDKELKVVVRNKAGQTHSLDLQLSSTRHRMKQESEDRILDGNIGYLRISSMSSSEERLEELTVRMQEFKDTDGLILDIRDNPGGSRDITTLLSTYFLPDNHPPIVANAAVFRTDETPHALEGYLENRSLYPLTSTEFDKKDRAAIKEFATGFKPKWAFPYKLFSQWHYFLLRPDRATPYYRKPVVVLVNARCFSAADVFAAAFKELPNVTLVGQTTGGGSGRSRSYTLPHSKIELRLSSMASFQPNGTLFEGNGVEPDVAVEESISDILRTTDSQLSAAVEMIVNHKN